MMNCVDYLFSDVQQLDKLFILGSKEQISYRTMFDRVLALAQWLNTEVGVDQKIVLSSANNSYFIIAYLAIMKSGNVCVPLNPGIEQEQLHFIADKTNTKTFFLSKQVCNRLHVAGRIIDEKIFEEIVTERSLLNSKSLATSTSQLAQIVYTSGTTAEPRGVMISHGNIVANTKSIIEYLSLNSDDVMEVVLPFYYCYGLSLLHTHLKVGASIVLNNTFMMLGSVFNDLKKYKCTGFAGVPSHFQVLLRKSDSFKKSEFPDLRYVTQAGGKLPTPFIKEFVEAFPAIQFFTMYGQTEATARLSYLPPNKLMDKFGSIGKAIPGVELDIVDEQGKSLEAGKTGEIVAKGDNVMLGYYNDLEGTKQILRDGWLYTGDLAYKDEDGFIYLTARSKEIIKVGGRRVSPKEIEEVILGMPGVVDCTIQSVEDDVLGEALKAILVVVDKAKMPTPEQVRQYCAGQLAIYKIPSFIEFADGLDVSATGKKVKKR